MADSPPQVLRKRRHSVAFRLSARGVGAVHHWGPVQVAQRRHTQRPGADTADRTGRLEFLRDVGGAQGGGVGRDRDGGDAPVRLRAPAQRDLHPRERGSRRAQERDQGVQGGRVVGQRALRELQRGGRWEHRHVR